MNSNNNVSRDRKIQQDARAWAKFTGINYTTALRHIEMPITQGFLGERFSARRLMNTLDNHPLIGADFGGWVLGEEGFYADEHWTFARSKDFVELALIIDFLRMFTPIRPGETPAVNSYKLKHTAEKFLKGHCNYVTNGRLIWAAAALDLPLIEEDGGAPHLMVGISVNEHDYVRRAVGLGNSAPKGHQHRPAGLTHLQTALEQDAAGELALGRWQRPEPSTEAFPFSDWLISQAGRDDVVGDLAGDYSYGVQNSDHRIATTAQSLLDILRGHSASREAVDSALEAITEWARIAPPEMRGDMSLRTEQLSGNKEYSAGWGAGAGSIERHDFLCPCGRGLIIEEHDNTPGFRESDVLIRCDRCRETWHLASGRSVRDWRVEPRTIAVAG